MVHMSVLRSPHAHARSARSTSRRCARIRAASARSTAARPSTTPTRSRTSSTPRSSAAAQRRARARRRQGHLPGPARRRRRRRRAAGRRRAARPDHRSTTSRCRSVTDGDEAVARARRVYDDQGWEDNVVIQIPFVTGDFEAAAGKAPPDRRGVPHPALLDSADRDARLRRRLESRARESYTFHGASPEPAPAALGALERAPRSNESQMRVIAPNVGGGFGLKMHGHPEEPLTCVFSRILDRPGEVDRGAPRDADHRRARARPPLLGRLRRRRHDRRVQ